MNALGVFFMLLLAALTAVSPVWAHPYPDPSTGVRRDGTMQGPDPKKDITTFTYWSPTTERIVLKATFPEDVLNVKVTLYNILGRMVDMYPPQPFSKNDKISFPFSAVGLPSGPYILVLEANGQRIVNKVVLSR